MPSFKHSTAVTASAAPPPPPLASSTTTTSPSSAAHYADSSSAVRSQWVKTFANGDSYNGEALHVNDKTQKPIKDGRGRYTWASSGAVYDGEWKGGRPHGQGVMTVPGTDGYEYTGGFVDGRRSGQGRCRFANGRTYDGEWREDEMNGVGTAHGAPGADDYVEYMGCFEAGKRSGSHGRCVYLNGDVYDGAWLAGKRQGMGEWQLHRPLSSLLPIAPVRYRGPFDKDVPHTSGSAEAEVDYSDGSSYVGAVNAQLRRHGRGVHRLASGYIFEGTFAQDQREGRGTLQSRADGFVCEGTWHHGQLDGEVHVTFTSAPDTGDTGKTIAAAAKSDLASDVRSLQQLRRGPHSVQSYHGPCSAGVLSGGTATILYTDGSSYHGTVRHGVPHGTGALRDRPLPFPSPATHDGDGGGSGGLRRRISSTCVPTTVSVTLMSYEGSFSAGVPDGSGTAEWQLFTAGPSSSPSSSPQLPSSPVPDAATVVRATPFNFSKLLAEGLRWWPTSTYAVVDGTYTGQWLRGLPHGKGKWQWVDGSSYVGDVAFYLPSGHGTYSGSSVVYAGDFKDGQPDGKGVLEDKTQGVSYDGEWSAGKPSGEGVCEVTSETMISSSNNSAVRSPRHSTNASFTSPCATVYEGWWDKGKPSGHGRTYANLDRQRVVYDGHYVDGRCDGTGTLYFGSVRRGSINSEAATAAVHAYAQYCGPFRDGHPGGGPGCLTLKNNTTIEGEFDGDLQPCRGATITVKPHNEAWIFTGTFDAATRVGKGTMTFPNGDVYKGEVKDATTDAAAEQVPPAPRYNLQRHGKGVYTFVEGNQLQCTWRHNVLHGAGVYTTADGTKTERTYADGVLMNDAAVSSVGAPVGLSSIGTGGGPVDNVFTPENEFPNTLSEEALKARLPEVQQQQQQQQQRKRAPFSFVRRGEARQASAVGTALSTTSPSPSSSSTASPKPVAAEGASGSNNNSTNAHRGTKRSPPAPSLSPTASAAQGCVESCNKNRSSPRKGSFPSTSAGAANTGAAGTTPARSKERDASSRDCSARTSFRKTGSTTAAVDSHKYSLRRHPNRNSPGGALGSPSSAPSTGAAAGGGSNANGLGDGRNWSGSSTNHTTPARGTVVPASNSVYLSRFQAGIRKLDNKPSRSPSPSDGKSESLSSAADAPAKHKSLPVTTPAWENGPLRRRLSSALAAGREQQQYQQQPQPGRRLPPVSLQESLKEMMKEACAIRNSREDEIHLLTEEMRQLNERIWQLRYFIANDSRGEDPSTTAAQATTTPTRILPSPKRRFSEDTTGVNGAGKTPPASKTQRLAALIQERRVVMEKLLYVVNTPE